MNVCDTSVLVDIDRGGIDDKVSRLNSEGPQVISTVSVTELRYGINHLYEPESETHHESIEGLNRLLSRFEIIPVTRPVATAAADIMAALRSVGSPLHDLHDVYIGATARTQELPILTANVDHFDRMPGVDVIDWSTY